jgi:hypothetical protein
MNIDFSPRRISRLRSCAKILVDALRAAAPPPSRS